MELPEIFKPLPFKEVIVKKEYQKRVLFVDTEMIYERIKNSINHKLRQQNVYFGRMFPNEKGICACGCGAILTGRKTRWATDECMHFAQGVWGIIAGQSDLIYSYMRIYYGETCVRCNTECSFIGKGICEHEHFNGKSLTGTCNNANECNNHRLDIDHIIPVKHGGGGCWLGNFQYLCNPCHKIKTIEDFNWKKKIIIPEHPKLF